MMALWLKSNTWYLIPRQRKTGSTIPDDALGTTRTLSDGIVAASRAAFAHCHSFLEASRAPGPEPFPCSLDKLVSEGEQRRRQTTFESASAGEIDDKLERGGLLERQLFRSRPVQNTRHIGSTPPLQRLPIRAIGHQAPDLRQRSVWTDEREAVLEGEFGDGRGFGEVLDIIENENRLRPIT